MSDESECRGSADGVPVKVGDVVWRSDVLRSLKLKKHHLGLWWPWFGVQIYSTERAAVSASLEREKLALAKARRETHRATAAIARLTERLKGKI